MGIAMFLSLVIMIVVITAFAVTSLAPIGDPTDFILTKIARTAI